jgi:TldD protein
MPVVVGPGWGGVLIHESLGHALEGDGIRRGTSLLTGRLGSSVASPIVRVVDDGRWQNGRGSVSVDDEGTPGQRTLLVDGGVVQSYLLDKLNAGLLGLRATGNGRRMSYRNWPLPRMTNTFIDAGASDPDSLLSGITKGFYAAELGGGSVDTTSGNFNFAVRVGYRIENGRITRPVRGAVLIGNSLETLQRIEGVGRDLAVDTTRGTCGKDGQMVAVGVGQPTVRFSAITVGGTAI